MDSSGMVTVGVSVKVREGVRCCLSVRVLPMWVPYTEKHCSHIFAQGPIVDLAS